MSASPGFDSRPMHPFAFAGPVLRPALLPLDYSEANAFVGFILISVVVFYFWEQVPGFATGFYGITAKERKIDVRQKR